MADSSNGMNPGLKSAPPIPGASQAAAPSTGAGGYVPGSGNNTSSGASGGLITVTVNPYSTMTPAQRPTGYQTLFPNTPMYLGDYLAKLNTAAVQQFQEQLYKAGLYGHGENVLNTIQWGDPDDSETQTALYKLSNLLQMYNQNGRYPDLNSVLDDLTKSGAANNDVSKPPRTQTSTTKSVNLTSASDAFQVMANTMQQLLGRNPTSEEARIFTNGLNQLEQANPQTTTTTTTTDYQPVVDSEGNVTGWQAGNQNSSSTTSGGNVNPNTEALNYLQRNDGEEGAAYSIMQYAKAFENALSGGIQLG